MKKIYVAYWHGKYSDLNYSHGQIFDYSEELRNKIISEVLDSGYSVMVRPNMGDDKDTLNIYIDNGRFTQR